MRKYDLVAIALGGVEPIIEQERSIYDWLNKPQGIVIRTDTKEHNDADWDVIIAELNTNSVGWDSDVGERNLILQGDFWMLLHPVIQEKIEALSTSDRTVATFSRILDMPTKEGINLNNPKTQSIVMYLTGTVNGLTGTKLIPKVLSITQAEQWLLGNSVDLEAAQ